ncbi:MAG: hypothetical protein ACOC8C_00635, partial [Chloroflexota bacterium]
MRVVHHLRDVYPSHRDPSPPSHVTIGVFDGVHLGHQRLIGELVEAAHAAEGNAVVITFDRHPASILADQAPLMLTTVGERLELMSVLRVDTAVVFPFTEEVVQTTADDFVGRLVHHLNLAEM